MEIVCFRLLPFFLGYPIKRDFEKGNKGYTLCVRFGVLLFPFITLPVRVR